MPPEISERKCSNALLDKIIIFHYFVCGNHKFMLMYHLKYKLLELFKMFLYKLVLYHKKVLYLLELIEYYHLKSF